MTNDDEPAPAALRSAGATVWLWTALLVVGVVVWGWRHWTSHLDDFGEDLARVAKADSLALALPLRNALRLAEAVDAALPAAAADAGAALAPVLAAEVGRRFADPRQATVHLLHDDGRAAAGPPVPALAAQVARPARPAGAVLGAAYRDGERLRLPLFYPRTAGGWIVVALDRDVVVAGWIAPGWGEASGVGLAGLDGTPLLEETDTPTGWAPFVADAAFAHSPEGWRRVPATAGRDGELLIGWARTSIGDAAVLVVSTPQAFAGLWWRREGAPFAAAALLALLGGVASGRLVTRQSRDAQRLARTARERDVARLSMQQAMDVARASTWTVQASDAVVRFDRPVGALVASAGGGPAPVADTLDGLVSLLDPAAGERLAAAVRSAIAAARPLRETFTVGEGPAARHFVIKGGPVSDPAGPGIVAAGVLRDVTATVRAGEQSLAAARTLDRVCARARIGPWDVELPSLRLNMSPAARDIYGIAADVPVDPWLDFHGSDATHRDALNAARRRLLDHGEPYDIVLPLQVDDARRWVRSVAEPRFDGGRLVGVDGSVQDVTEVVAVRDELQAQQARLQAMAEAVAASSQLLLVTDLAQRIVWCNETFTRRTGFTLPDIAGQRPGPLLQRDSVPQAYRRQMAARIAQRQGFAGMRLQNFTRDGEPYWIDLEVRVLHDAEGRATGFLGIQTDVTDDIEREDHLRRMVQRFDLATRHARIGVFERDMTSRESRWNPTMFELFGLPPAELPPPDDVVASRVLPDDLDGSLPAFDRAAVQPGTRGWEGSFRVRLPDGQARWLHCAAVIERDADGRAVRAVGTVVDTTAIHDAESERLARAGAEARDHAKSLFLARMSHELRTPLNAVVGFAQLIRDAGRVDESTAARAERIERTGWHLLQLINDVLDLSKIDAGTMPVRCVPVDLGALLRECVELSMPDAEAADVALGDAPATRLRVRADPVRLRQVVLNLLSNAIKYNRPGGQVRIVVDTAGDEATLAIVDDGLGMTAEQTSRLFEAFNRLGRESSPIPGTGIGLAIVRSLVERMAGRIEVRSAPLKGSTFTVALPLAPAGEPRDRDTASGPDDRVDLPLPDRLQVLCLEDNAVNAMVLCEALGHVQAGWTVTVAETLEQAADAIVARVPDLTFVDLNLGSEDGLRVVETLRAREPAAVRRVVVLSADVASPTVDRCRAAGVQHFLPKPFALGELQQVLRATLATAPAAEAG